MGNNRLIDQDQMLARFQWRQISDDDGNPTDSGVVTTSKRLQFFVPCHHKQTLQDGTFKIRTDWMGFQEYGVRLDG